MEGINEGDAVDADVVDKKNPPKSSSQDLPTSGRSRGSTGATGTGGGSLSSLDSSWNWNQAQTADGRTYYFNEKKQVKWTLTLEEKMKMLQTLELSFRKMEGYMFKRAPRATDSDKSNLRRMMTPHWKTLFKKRYFVLEPSQKMLYYYADMSKQQVLGSLDLQQVSAVSTNLQDQTDMPQLPTEYILNITTHSRVWTFVCITGEEQAAWNQCMQLMIFQNTQLRDARVLGAKADEVTKSGKRASIIMSSVKRKNSRVSNNETVAEKIAHMLAKKKEHGSNVDSLFHENQTENVRRHSLELGIKVDNLTLFGSGRGEGSPGGGEDKKHKSLIKRLTGASKRVIQGVGGDIKRGNAILETQTASRRLTNLFPGRNMSVTANQRGNIEKQHERIQSWKMKGGANKRDFIMGNVASSCISITSEADISASKFCQFLFINLGIGELALTQFFDLHGRVRFLKEGEYLTEENSEITTISLILAGEFLRQKNIHGDQYGISVLEVGDVCGIEEGELGYCVSSVVAGCNAWVFDFNYGVFIDFIKSMVGDRELKEVFAPFQKVFLANLLSCVPLLLDLEPPVLGKIAKNFSIRKYVKKGRIFSFEDKASEFVIIMNGTCKATHSDRGAGGDAGSEMEADKETSEEEKHKSTSHEQIVGLYSSGDWLNDDALKNNRNNPVNLTAVSDKVLILCTDRAGFEEMLDIGGEGLLNSIQRVVSGRLAQSMNKTPLFFGMASMTSKFAQFMHFDEVPACTQICRQFGKCDGFYIVLSGTLNLIVESIAGIKLRKSVVKQRIKMHDFFGANWLLYNGGIAQGTVMTTSHCVLLRTPASSFDELQEICPLLRTRLDRMHEKQKELDERELDLVKAVEEAVEMRKGRGMGDSISDETL